MSDGGPTSRGSLDDKGRGKGARLHLRPIQVHTTKLFAWEKTGRVFSNDDLSGGTGVRWSAYADAGSLWRVSRRAFRPMQRFS